MTLKTEESETKRRLNQQNRRKAAVRFEQTNSAGSSGRGIVVPVINLQIKFPVIGLKIPVSRNNFPVSLSRELLDKRLQHSGFVAPKPSPNVPELQNSLLNSLIAGNLLGDGCDQHCVASHAFVRFPWLPKRRQDRPNTGFSRVSFRLCTPVSAISRRNRRKSPALYGNIPVLRRLSAETGLITTSADGCSRFRM